MGRSIALLVLLLTASAAAQNDDEALMHRGVELRKQGQNAEALALFRQANERSPSARAQAQIALAQQALGHWVEAEAGLVAVLSEEHDAWIERNREVLEAALATIRDHLGTLEIETSVDGAKIVVNGAIVGTSPLPGAVRLVAGTAHIEVEAEGYGTVKREIDVPPHGSVAAAIVVVRPAASSAAHAPENPSAAAARNDELPGAARTDVRASSRAERTEPTHGARTVGVVLLATAVPLLATGVVAHIVRENNAQAYNAPSCFTGNKTRDQRCPDKRDATHTATAIAAIGYSTGAAALITGLTLLLTDTHNEQPSTGGVRLDASLDPHAVYLQCSGKL